MSDKKKKKLTLSVYQAIFNDEIKTSLSELFSSLREAGAEIDTVVSKGFFDSVELKFPSFPAVNHAGIVQFDFFEEGATRTAISPNSASDSLEDTIVSAHDGGEFLDNRVIVLADHNYMIVCGLGNRKWALIDAIGQFADRCNIDLPPASLDFLRTPNRLSLQQIQQIGVKSVKFNAASLLGSVDVSEDGLCRRIWGTDMGPSDIERANLVSEVSINTKYLGKARIERGEVVRHEGLRGVGEVMCQDPEIESYTIVLNDDSEWTDGNLTLTRTVEVSKEGSSFRIEDVLAQMVKYRDYLNKNGYLT